MGIEEIQAVIEGMLFASGDVLSVHTIAQVLEIDKGMAASILDRMAEEFNKDNRGLRIIKVNDGYQLSTRPEHFEYIKRLFEPKSRLPLSQAALETLSIVAYNQPVTRVEIEQIRGVNSDSSLGTLLERDLIREAGRLDAPGKPVLYETTEEFFRAFGYESALDFREQNKPPEPEPVDSGNEDETGDTQV